MIEPPLSIVAKTNINKTVPYSKAFRILVVIPTLGERLETLCRTLSSVKAQSGVTVDIVLVAKTKTLELLAVADLYKVRIIFHPGHISAAINAGFAQAGNAHKYLYWLGDDDMLRPNALANASALLEHNPTAVVAYGACDYVDLNGNLLFSRRPPPLAPALLQIIPGLIKQEACLFRLSTLQQVGGLDENLKYTMDLDLLLKLSRHGPFLEINQVLAAFCWHPDSLTISNRGASLTEAQHVQGVHARGIIRMMQSIWKPAIKYLILVANWKINRSLEKARKPSGEHDKS